MFALPFDKVGQHLARCLAIANKIVVDEIDSLRTIRLLAYGVEFTDNLLRCLEPGLAAIEARYVAEFAAIGAAARKLQCQQQIIPQPHQVIGRDRKITERNALLRAKLHLRGRRHDARIQPFDQGVGSIAEFAEVQIIDIRIHFRGGRDRGPAKNHDPAGRLDARQNVTDLRRLNVHAAGEDRIRPGEVGGRGRPDVFVDETDLPFCRHVGRDQQEPLGRHECAHTGHQLVGMGERTE